MVVILLVKTDPFSFVGSIEGVVTALSVVELAVVGVTDKDW